MSLEDIQQTVVYIPYAGEESDPDPEPTLPSAHLENDLDTGPQLRFDAYKTAWTRCLDRVKVIIAELYNPVIAGVTSRLENIHSDVIPGLPFPELPVITVTDLSGGSLFLDDLSARLDSQSGGGHDDGQAPTFVNHLYPGDCLNITSAMRNLTGGFIDRDTAAPKRKPAASLAPYDLGLLQAWYDAAEDSSPSLVVLLQEFEQFDSDVVQDMLYICSLQASRLPLTFILSLSSPSPAAYLRASFTRATLALLRVYHFPVPSGPDVLDTVLFKTFFDPTFEPLLLPGPTLLEFIEDYYTTHNASLNTLITVLQVAHLKHYTSDTFSLLSTATPAVSPNPTPSELRFLESLLARLHATTASDASQMHSEDWLAHARSPGALLQAVDSARETFSLYARRTRLGFSVLNIVVTFLRGRTNDKLVDHWTGPVAMSKLLDGDGVSGLILSALRATELDSLLGELHRFYHGMPQHIRDEESDARSKLVRFKAKIAEAGDTMSVKERDNITSWLENCISDLLQPLEESTPLWNMWYTGLTPFPSDLINPALRPTILSGLSFPYPYCGTEEPEDEDDENLQDLPDTSILFKGYTKAGKMINVYDWFDHFRVVLEGQRQAELAKANKGKGKGRKKTTGIGAEDDEKWKLAVQARFMRSLHELDYLGFIKHTSRGGGGRKGEFVMKTVLGLVD
ncbi:origin recognition complex subunit 3 N-terminus-domain-containing protein [Mycena sp. CBHHK59/15]|nr:origin recognition complex subunit 3 N-terminus-domain-containing protein [Mycena sp. CBHHK59/15]